MIPEELQVLIEQVKSLDINVSTRTDLLDEIKKLQKVLLIADFKVRRIDKDKFITTNLLKTSVEELEKNKEIIEENNQLLKEQKKKVEAKNMELRKQKLVVERQSRQLKAHLKELETSYHEMEQFTYIASHDLQSPLRTITNFATLLQERYKDQFDQQGRDFLRFINKGTGQMRQVINDLLHYSRAGRKDHPFEKTDLNEILKMVCFNLHQAIEESQAELIIAPLPTLYVNKSGLVQLFQNLLSNAIKFRAEHRPRLRISCEQQEEQWVFQVADNGLGMDEAFQSKAFLPFQRVNHLDRPGTGIGLAICEKVVKLHCGDIHFTSVIGEGTTFVFTISSTLADSPEQLLLRKKAASQ